MNKQRLKYLFQKYFEKTASEAERDELMQYIENASEEKITPFLKEAYDTIIHKEQYLLSKEKREKILNSVFANNHIPSKDISHDGIGTIDFHSRLPWIKHTAIAALLLIGLTISFLFYNNYSPLINPVAQKPSKVDAAPGGDIAILTLADGSTISLNDRENGKIAEQSGIVITKTDDGQILYTLNKATSGSKNEAPVFNTISTPRGGQFQIILPDGTKVWLNAASSLKYPTLFSKSERKVELKGEGYFEVKRDATSPFIVLTDNQVVTVLGTHFNINSYKDNNEIKTTLLEGSVMVSANMPNINMKLTHKVLKPGEQSVLNSLNDLKVSNVNTSNVIAWKNGLFHFENTNIKEVMEEFSRWYNVDFKFEGKVPNVKLWGSAYRNVSASEALDILSYFNLKFRIIEGSADNNKTIIISQL